MPSTPGWLVAHAAHRSALVPIPVIPRFWTHQIGMSLTEIMILRERSVAHS